MKLIERLRHPSQLLTSVRSTGDGIDFASLGVGYVQSVAATRTRSPVKSSDSFSDSSTRPTYRDSLVLLPVQTWTDVRQVRQSLCALSAFTMQQLPPGEKQGETCTHLHVYHLSKDLPHPSFSCNTRQWMPSWSMRQDRHLCPGGQVARL